MRNPFSIMNGEDFNPYEWNYDPQNWQTGGTPQTQFPQENPIAIADPSWAFDPQQVPGAGTQLPAPPVQQPAQQAWNPWTGWNIQSVDGPLSVPRFRVSDLDWTAGAGSQPQWVETGGDAGGYWHTPPMWEQGQHLRWNPEARNLQDLYGHWATASPQSHNFELFADPSNPSGFSIRVKTDRRQGTRIPFVRRGDEWVPDQAGVATEYWDTNPTVMDQLGPFLPLLGAGAGLAGVFGSTGAIGGPLTNLGNTISAALPGGAAAGPGSMVQPATVPGMSVPGAYGPMSVPAGTATGATGLGTFGQVSAGLPAATTGLGGAGGVGAVAPGAVAPPVTGGEFGPPPYTGSPGGVGGGSPGPWSPGAVGGVGNVVSQVGRGAGAVQNLINALRGGQGGQAGGNAGGLMGLLAALYGANRQGAYADDLRGIASQMQQMANPYLQQLQQTYENPQAFMESPEMQAVLGLEANRLTGIDAARGRLSTDIGRTAKLQELAQARLGDHRRGLQQSIQTVFQPQAIASLFREAAGRDAGRFGGLSQFFGAGGNVGDIFGDIRGIIEAGGDLWDVINDWWE